MATEHFPVVAFGGGEARSFYLAVAASTIVEASFPPRSEADLAVFLRSLGLHPEVVSSILSEAAAALLPTSGART